MKRSVKSLMALAMAVSMAILSGCGAAAPGNSIQDTAGLSKGQTSVEGENQTGNKAENNTEANAEVNSSTGEKTVIEYWHCNAETQGGLVVDELVRQFNESNDHIQVVAKYNPDMYKGLMQNLQAEAAAGNSPALVQIGWAFLDYFSNNFSYVPPQEAIDKFDKEEASFLQDKFLPNILELAVNSEGSQVGIPYSLSNPVLYINKDILREAGLPENGPTTWQEVSEFAKIIKEKTGKYGYHLH